MATPQNVLDSLDAMNTAFATYGDKVTAVTNAQTSLNDAQAVLTSAQTIVMGASMAKSTAFSDYTAATMQLSMIQQSGTAEQIAAAQATVNSTYQTYLDKSNDYANALTAQTTAQNDVNNAQIWLTNAQAAKTTAKTNSNTALDALVGSCNQTWRLY